MKLTHLFSVEIIPLGDFVTHDYSWALAGIFAAIGIMASFYNIFLHLAHWTRPVYQLWIVRILFIVPLYAIISFISIREESLGLYMEIIRDCYEAFVIYCFLIWILNVIGGEEACAVSIAQRMNMKHPFPLCCLPPLRLNAAFLRTCKQMTLQFVILKPVTAVISFSLLLIGGEQLYYNSIWQLIMLTAYNVSYTLALYGLFLFYVATKDDMGAYSPVRKFLAVKAIVFLTYWQALFIPIVFGSEYADKTNDFILCLEMVIFAFMHYRAFPWWEFKYKKIAIDPSVGYKFTNFDGIDGNDENENDEFEEKELSISRDLSKERKRSIDEPEISDDYELSFQSNQRTETKRHRRKSSENLAIITEEVKSVRSWCSAFCEVMNFMDVCDDAKRNFVVVGNKKKNKENENNNGRISRQNSYEYDENGNVQIIQNNENCKKGKQISNNMLNATLLFDEPNNTLSTQKKRTEMYRYESNHINIELIESESY